MRGWEEFDRVEPMGLGRLYEFLGHAFVKLATAFHSPEYAFGLTLKSFVWWLDPDDEDSGRDMTEAEISAYFDAAGRGAKAGTSCRT